MGETGWTKEFPPLSGFYWMRGFRQYRTLPVEVNGNKFVMYGNRVLFDATDAEGAEFLGPLSPADADQLSELRKAMQFQYDALCELCEDGLTLPPSVHARLANMRDDARVALNPKQPEKETQLKTQPQPVITLEPPWWRCKHGTEFRSPTGKRPQVCPRTPPCRGEDIQMVIEVDPVFSRKEHGSNED